MKRSRTKKSPWIKSKTKPGPNKKNMDDFHPDRRQNLAESDKDPWFNQHSESEAASASSLDISAVSKEIYNGSEESRREQCYDRATSKNDYSPSSYSSLPETSASLFCLWKHVFFFSLCPLLTTAKTCASFNSRAALVPWFVSFFGEARCFPFVLPIVDHN